MKNIEDVRLINYEKYTLRIMLLLNKVIIYSVILICISGCAGTIKTIVQPNLVTSSFKKAYIISTEESQYIKFKFGVISPFGYIPPLDDAPESRKVIGNTAQVIQQELANHGIDAVIGKRGDSPENFDLIIEYNDTWRWDFKKILDRLEIIFITSDGGKEIARSTYNIYRNKEMHNFPTPEKEVPKMIKELLAKIES